MFGASQHWGKVGRAFLRVICERQLRQYQRFPRSFDLDEPLVPALNHWKLLIKCGPPRTMDFQSNKKADVVIFTDGFTPDPRPADQRPDRVGGVLFDRRLRPGFRELPRSSRLIAPLLALATFEDRVYGADVRQL